MKKQIVATAVLAGLVLVGAAQVNPMAQTRSAKVEYIDIRWDSVDRMCVIYPDGRVVFFGEELKGIQRPDDANKRAFYLTIEMNRLAAQGYEFVGGWSDEIIMKRTVSN
ncbi:MAG TPA: hypothetical protein VGU20_26580 [Stellaceae bacterium]|nr:hypothetical protein [Stellaceae bacterium]